MACLFISIMVCHTPPQTQDLFPVGLTLVSVSDNIHSTQSRRNQPLTTDPSERVYPNLRYPQLTPGTSLSALSYATTVQRMNTLSTRWTQLLMRYSRIPESYLTDYTNPTHLVPPLEPSLHSTQSSSQDIVSNTDPESIPSLDTSSSMISEDSTLSTVMDTLNSVTASSQESDTPLILETDDQSVL